MYALRSGCNRIWSTAVNMLLAATTITIGGLLAKAWLSDRLQKLSKGVVRPFLLCLIRNMNLSTAKPTANHVPVGAVASFVSKLLFAWHIRYKMASYTSCVSPQM